MQRLHNDQKESIRMLNIYKQSLDEWFQEYCNDKYNTNVGIIKSDIMLYEEQTIEEQEIDEEELIEDSEKTEQIIFSALQREMFREMSRHKKCIKKLFNI